MRNTLAIELVVSSKQQNVSAVSRVRRWRASRQGHPRAHRWSIIGFALLSALGLQTGCVELVHWGHISDRENSWAVNNVTISQHQADGTWKKIGTSDGKGRWEVFKENIKGGGRIKVEKDGYYTQVMPESEFLQKHVILMQGKGAENDGASMPSDWMN